MRTYVRENEQIWNKQFPAVSSHDLHRENKTVATEKFCQLIDLGPVYMEVGDPR